MWSRFFLVANINFYCAITLNSHPSSHLCGRSSFISAAMALRTAQKCATAPTSLVRRVRIWASPPAPLAAPPIALPWTRQAAKKAGSKSGSSTGGHIPLRRLNEEQYETIIEELLEALFFEHTTGLSSGNEFRLKFTVEFSSDGTTYTVTAELDNSLSCESIGISCEQALDDVAEAQSTFVDGLSADVENGTFGNELNQTITEAGLEALEVDPASFSIETGEPIVKVRIFHIFN